MPVLFWSNELNMNIQLEIGGQFGSSESDHLILWYLCVFIFIFESGTPGLFDDFWFTTFLEVVISFMAWGDVDFPAKGQPLYSRSSRLYQWQDGPPARAKVCGDLSTSSVKRFWTAIQWVISGKPHEFEMFLNLWAIKHALFHHPGWILSWPCGVWLQPCCQLSPICCLKLATGRPFS